MLRGPGPSLGAPPPPPADGPPAASQVTGARARAEPPLRLSLSRWDRNVRLFPARADPPAAARSHSKG